jgi:hypothetical protein
MTYEEAAAWLTQYERDNEDLPPQLCRLLGVFALAARRCPRRVLWKFTGGPTTIPYRDQSRRWWLVLRESKCARHWKVFKETAETAGVSRAWRDLRRSLTPTQLALVKRRAGVLPGHPSIYNVRKGRWRWYKGGAWPDWSPWTKLLVLREPLERPIHTPLHAKIASYRLRLLELEVYHKFHAKLDTLTVPEMKWAVARYVQQRLSELIGWQKRRVSMSTVAWFLQCAIPRDGYRTWKRDGRRGSYRGSAMQMSWM